MHVGPHQVRAKTIRWFRDAVFEEGRTRNSLSRDLCTLEDWTGARGEYCLASARKSFGRGGGRGERLAYVGPRPLIGKIPKLPLS